MKVKNIAFSGFMAAIMLSVTGAANAAVQIASQAYVDAQDAAAVTSAVSQAVTQVENKGYLTQTDASNTYVTNDGATTIIENTLKDTETITQILTDTTGGLGAALDAKADQSTVDELATSVGALETAVGDETSGLVKDVADAAAAAAAAQGDVDALDGVVNNETTGLATKASQADLTALTGRVSTNEANIDKKADKITVAEGQAGNFATVDANGQYQVSTVKTSDLVTNADVTQKITEALEGNESVKEIITTIVSNGDVVTDAIDKSVAEGTLKTELDLKADKADTYTKTETNTAISDYAIPRAGANCTAESGRCVLSVDTSGNFIWVDVTAPLGE